MGFRDGLRAALGGGSAPKVPVSSPSTKDREKAKKAKAKEAAASKDRARRHQHVVKRYGSSEFIPFDD